MNPLEQPKGPPSARSKEWSELEGGLKKSLKFQESLVKALRTIISSKKFGRETIREYRRLQLTRSVDSNEVIGKIVPETGAELRKRLENDAEFRQMFLRSLEIESSSPLVPEISAFEKKAATKKTIGELLVFAEEENVALSKEDISDAKNLALNLLRDREDVDES